MKFQLLASFAVLASSFTNSLVFAIPYFSGFNIGAGKGPGGCKTTADFEDDFWRIKSWSTNNSDKFDTVKLFETAGCDALANAVPAAIKTNITIWAGIWPSNEANFNKEKDALIAAIQQYGGKWLKGVNVGSEMLYRKEIKPDVLARWIWEVKGLVQIALKLPNVPVGTADTWDTWVDDGNVYVWEACDVVLMNVFPYWQGQPVSKGLQTFVEAFEATNNSIKRSGPKALIVGETGWPSAGDNFGAAIACPTCLQKYYTDVACWLQKHQVSWFWFSAYDEPLKQPAVEKNFGIATFEKTPKISFRCP